MTDASAKIELARRLLAPPREADVSPAHALGAAAFAAVTAVMLATTVVLGPGFELDEQVVIMEVRP